LAAALQGWADLIVLSPPDAPWLATVREQMQRAAQELGIDPGGVSPSAEAQELAAERGLTGRERANLEAWQNLSPGEREAMIRAMVDGLAQRLAQHPDDAEGWRRLARAYEVLGETEKAREARTRAESLTGR
jgi:cytochrome c-type biogenesis protein CcmH